MLATRRHRTQHPLHEPAPGPAGGPAADPTPEHGVPQGTLRRVVRRLDPDPLHEGPEGRLDPPQLRAGPLGPAAPAPLTERQGRPDSRLHPADQAARCRPLQGPVPHPMPPAEQAARGVEQLSADRLGDAAPVDHRLEIPTQMRPTDLPPARHDPVVRTEPVAADDLTVFAPQERLGDIAASGLGDREDREQWCHRRPLPDLAEPLLPRRLVDVRRPGAMDGDRQFVVRGFQDCGRFLLQLGDHAGGDREQEHVGGDLADMTLAEAVGPREHRQHGLKVRAEASGRDAPGQLVR